MRSRSAKPNDGNSGVSSIYQQWPHMSTTDRIAALRRLKARYPLTISDSGLVYKPKCDHHYDERGACNRCGMDAEEVRGDAGHPVAYK